MKSFVFVGSLFILSATSFAATRDVECEIRNPSEFRGMEGVYRYSHDENRPSVVGKGFVHGDAYLSYDITFARTGRQGGNEVLVTISSSNETPLQFVSDKMSGAVAKLNSRHPKAAVTFSLGNIEGLFEVRCELLSQANSVNQ